MNLAMLVCKFLPNSCRDFLLWTKIQDLNLVDNSNCCVQLYLFQLDNLCLWNIQAKLMNYDIYFNRKSNGILIKSQNLRQSFSMGLKQKVELNSNFLDRVFILIIFERISKMLIQVW
ncbi:unnamed protein product [Paramecium sonneborni]|uniref:Uncharacterized protein n=1 Tax=Paramecium sonneborni TaxID=65129 RepID=A0A8S1RT54_9CILI|nr:unnamed protein product [Paramecium sonneborni]